MKTEILQKYFNETQIEILKDAVKYGIWGDTEIAFTKDVESYAIGCCTNDIREGKRFFGKKLSGLLSGMSKIIEDNKLTCIYMESDWWGDGSGDMLFFNVKELETSWNDLIEWSC